MRGPARFEEISEALKVAAAALRRADVPFLLGGSLSAWARGGPTPHNDLDLMVRPLDAERAMRTLAEAGMETARPPEEWLYKAWHRDTLIDLIFGPAGLALTDEVFARADTRSVLAVSMRVMALEDVLVTKLSALDEHALDYAGLLAISRSLREQIDWQQLQARLAGSPYARAFLFLVRELGITGESPAVAMGEARRVRIVPPDALTGDRPAAPN